MAHHAGEAPADGYDADMSIQRAIDALSDPTIAVDDALRHVLIVGTRIQSDSIKEWVNAELFGYPDTATVPEYRKLEQEVLRVEVHFARYGGQEFKHPLVFEDLPRKLHIFENGLPLRQPANSLSKLAGSGNNITAAMPVPTQWCSLYNHLSDEIALQTPMAQAVAAQVVMDKGMIGDVVSAVRTSALKLLLELEQADPHAGEPGGPTVEDSEKLRVIDVRIGTLHGPLVLTAGDNNDVSAQSAENDLTVIYERAAEFITASEVENLKAALKADGGKSGKETEKFLERVKSGAVNLVGDITASAAYDGLSLLIQSQF